MTVFAAFKSPARSLQVSAKRNELQVTYIRDVTCINIAERPNTQTCRQTDQIDTKEAVKSAPTHSKSSLRITEDDDDADVVVDVDVRETKATDINCTSKPTWACLQCFHYISARNRRTIKILMLEHIIL